MAFSQVSDELTKKDTSLDREWLREDFNKFLSQGKSTFVLVGEPGMGKTVFLRSLYDEHPGSVFVQISKPLGTDQVMGFWSALLLQLDLEGSKIPPTAYECAKWAALNLPADNHLRLVIIDALDKAPGLFDSTGLAGLNNNIPGVAVVIATRPGPHLDALYASGAHIVCLDSFSQDNYDELREWVVAVNTDLDLDVAESVASHAGGNFMVADYLLQAVKSGEIAPHDLNVTPPLLEAAFGAIWEELITSVPCAERDDFVGVACMIAEAGEPLPDTSLADFLGFTASKVRGIINRLAPILRFINNGYAFFNERMGQFIARRYQRELVLVHQRIISFFRDSYPSWEEMDDRYGWFYLGHHCDRLARTARRRDFSSLHWLGEGPYIKAKLEHTHSLKAVLQDLTRCLKASLEERNLQQIAGYGLRIPRLRAREVMNGLHDLADIGQFDLAIERALLLRTESSRVKALLLLAWQAVEENQLDAANNMVELARNEVLPNFVKEERLLYAYVFADLLVALKPDEILPILLNCKSRDIAVDIVLRISLIDTLPRDLKKAVLACGMRCAKLIDDEKEQEKQLKCLTDELSALKNAKKNDETEHNEALILEVNDVSCDYGHNEILKNALNSIVSAEDPLKAFRSALEIASKIPWETSRVGAFAAVTKELIPLADEPWSLEAFESLISCVVSLRQPQERQRAVVAITRLVTGVFRVDGWESIFTRIAAIIETLEDPGLRVRSWIWLALARFIARDFRGASDVLNQSTSLAFHIFDLEEQAKALALLASCAASIDNSTRARNLAFHSLQAWEAPSPARIDTETKAAIVVGVSANVTQERSLEYIDSSIKAAQAIPDMRVRASLLSALAGGLYKLEEKDWARKIQDKSLGVARAMDPGGSQAKTLAVLANQESLWGNISKADQVIKEAEQTARGEESPVLRREALLVVANSRRVSGDDAGAKAILAEVINDLNKLTNCELAKAADLSMLAGLVQSNLKLRETFVALLKKIRKALRHVSLSVRDEGLLSLGQCWLVLGEEQQARDDLYQIVGIACRLKGRVALARSVITSSPDEALELLSRVGVFEERMRGVRECAQELLRDSVRSRRKEVQDILAELTVMASEDEVTADYLVSRWVSLSSDRKAIVDALNKLGYQLDDIMAGKVKDNID